MKQFYRAGVAAIFLCGAASAQSTRTAVEQFLNGSATFRGVSADQKQFTITNEDVSKSLGGSVVQIQQTYNGIPIYNATSSALVKDGAVVYMADNFQKNIVPAGKVTPGDGSSLFGSMVAKAGISVASKQNAKNYKAVYFPADGVLKYAYEYNFEDAAGNLWNVVADAQSGDILSKQNLTLSCNFAPATFGRESINPFIGPSNKTFAGNFVAADNATYNVFALPTEAPSFGDRTLVSNPWILAASPDGWHSDGTNSYTYTRGNNAYAYTDLNSTNTIGSVADGGASRNFDFPLDINQTYDKYQNAALTNLFYMNNKMHDISYQFGFNEAARNFQVNNYGKGGVGSDPVMAEARDGATATPQNLNNANFATPSDGSSPRMQMYLWSPKKVQRLFYNSPDSFKDRTPATQSALFGPALTPTGVTGNLALTTPADGCSAISEDLTGKIAVIARGTCNYVTKVKNAQTQGAIATIVYNVPSSTSFGTMGGTDATITIPSILVDSNEGSAIVNQLASTPINATLSDDPSKYINLDGDLDNGIIAHEYTHGISNRNTGSGYNCLNYSTDNEQMGEGWSDFFALMVTLRPTDNASVPRGIGTFAAGQNPTDLGIRPAKYSPDFSINPYTYGKTNGMVTTDTNNATVPDVHSIGFVWATMLWDLNWKYAAKYGYNSDILADKNSGTARVVQLVMDGLKLQGCNPSFVAGRDALIAADKASTGGDNKCLIWNVFAARGLGVNAKPGLIKPKSSTATNVTAALNDQVEDFTVPAECSGALATSEASAAGNIMVYPNPAKTEIRFRGGDQLSGKTFVTVYDMAGKLVLQDRISLSTDAVNVSSLAPGVYIVKGENLSAKFTQKLIVTK